MKDFGLDRLPVAALLDPRGLVLYAFGPWV